MIQNIKFKNRITQEDNDTLKILSTNIIRMNDDQQTTPDTPDGYFFVTIQPNTNLDYEKLRHDFNYALCRYYRWALGNRFTEQTEQQFKFMGIFEKQAGEYLHIHLIMRSLNIKAFNIFIDYITTIFKTRYKASSFSIQRIYNLRDCLEYINPNYNDCLKDIYVSKKRIEAPIPFSHTDFMKNRVSQTNNIYDYFGTGRYLDMIRTIFGES